jgi:hypothetical protein
LRDYLCYRYYHQRPDPNRSPFNKWSLRFGGLAIFD